MAIPQAETNDNVVSRQSSYFTCSQNEWGYLSLQLFTFCVSL